MANLGIEQNLNKKFKLCSSYVPCLFRLCSCSKIVQHLGKSCSKFEKRSQLCSYPFQILFRGWRSCQTLFKQCSINISTKRGQHTSFSACSNFVLAFKLWSHTVQIQILFKLEDGLRGTILHSYFVQIKFNLCSNYVKPRKMCLLLYTSTIRGTIPHSDFVHLKFNFCSNYVQRL